MHILSPKTDNCPSWISGRERMTVENISWSVSTKECCRPRRGLNPWPPGLQSDGVSNWATEVNCLYKMSNFSIRNPVIYLLTSVPKILAMKFANIDTIIKTRAVVGQRSSPAGYILYCNIFIIKKFKMYNNNKTQTHNEFLLRLK